MIAPHLQWDWAHRCHIHTGTGLNAAHICTGTWLGAFAAQIPIAADMLEPMRGYVRTHLSPLRDMVLETLRPVAAKALMGTVGLELLFAVEYHMLDRPGAIGLSREEGEAMRLRLIVIDELLQAWHTHTHMRAHTRACFRCTR
jgi:hypothetical protein